MSDDLGRHILAVATTLWGAPRPGATKTEVRFGDARTVNPVKGTWWVHGEDVGGGVLDLIVHEGKATDRKGAIEWMRQQGYPIEDRAPSSNGAARQDRGDEPWHSDNAKKELVKTWDYTDEAGAVLYQTTRFQFRLSDRSWRLGSDGKPDKTYSQRRKAQPGEENRDGWVYSLKGSRLVPYRLGELQEAISQDLVVFFAEGEKAVDALAELGVPATCNPMGAGKWWDELTPFFKGARIVILPDNDDPGRKHRDLVAGKLKGTAQEVRVLDLLGLPQKGDAWDWIAAGGTAERLYELAATATIAGATPFVSRFGALRWRDIDQPGPEHEYLIDDFLTLGDKSVIGGPSKSGKSFLSIHAGLSVARGVDFFGRPVKRGLVIYQAGEGARGVKKRLRAYRRHFAVNGAEDIPFVLLQSKIDLYSAAGDTEALIQEIRSIEALYPDFRLMLVVIDTLATAQGGADENSGKDMGAVMGNVDRINRETGAHVCLVHHMNADGKKLRGHTSVYANTDQVITVVRDEATKIRTVTLDKQKDDEDGVNFKFELLPIEVGQRDDGRSITSCVVVDVGEKAKVQEAKAAQGFRLRENEELVFKALLIALKEQGEQAHSDLKLPLGTQVVRARFWKAVFEKIAPFETGSELDDAAQKRRAEAIRKQLERAGKSLFKYNVIGRSEPFVWWTGRPVRGFPETFDRTSDQESRTYQPHEPDDYEVDPDGATGFADDDISDLIPI